jgi:hypothetical protein
VLFLDIKNSSKLNKKYIAKKERSVNKKNLFLYQITNKKIGYIFNIEEKKIKKGLKITGDIIAK